MVPESADHLIHGNFCLGQLNKSKITIAIQNH